jgi:hypothetical protein
MSLAPRAKQRSQNIPTGFDQVEQNEATSRKTPTLPVIRKVLFLTQNSDLHPSVRTVRIPNLAVGKNIRATLPQLPSVRFQRDGESDNFGYDGRIKSESGRRDRVLPGTPTLVVGSIIPSHLKFPGIGNHESRKKGETRTVSNRRLAVRANEMSPFENGFAPIQLGDEGHNPVQSRIYSDQRHKIHWENLSAERQTERTFNTNADGSDAASPKGQSSIQTLYLDGSALGRWAIQHLERALAKPTSGMTGIDPRAAIPRSRVAPY